MCARCSCRTPLVTFSILTVFRRSLSVNGIRDDCIDFIGNWIAKDRRTLSLSLWGNHIKAAGLTQLLSRLQHNTTLASLNLGGNDFRQSGFLAIRECCLRLRRWLLPLH